LILKEVHDVSAPSKVRREFPSDASQTIRGGAVLQTASPRLARDRLKFFVASWKCPSNEEKSDLATTGSTLIEKNWFALQS
jgi:hypothetical protein